MDAHPAAALFPMMSDAALHDLASDIKANGQRSAIVTYKGQILDGRNRFAACAIVGARPILIEWDQKPGESPWDFVWSLNAERRHLDAGQKTVIRLKVMRGSEEWRAEIAAKQAEVRANKGGRPKKGDEKTSRHVTGGFDAPAPKSSVEAIELAKASGTSAGTAERALRLEKKSPELFEKVAAGEMSLPAALTKASQPKAPEPVVPVQKAAVSDDHEVDPAVAQVLGPFRARAEALYKLLRQCDRDARELRKNIPIANQATALTKAPEMIAAIGTALRFAEAMVPRSTCPHCGGVKPFCAGRVRCGGWTSIVKEAAE